MGKKKIDEEIIEELNEEPDVKTVKIDEKKANSGFDLGAILDSSDDNKDVDYKIALELLSDDHIERKTELDLPIHWSVLTTIADIFNARGLSKSHTILNDFIVRCYKLLISKNRKSRSEYVQALQSVNEKNANKPKDINPMGVVK